MQVTFHLHLFRCEERSPQIRLLKYSKITFKDYLPERSILQNPNREYLRLYWPDEKTSHCFNSWFAYWFSSVYIYGVWELILIIQFMYWCWISTRLFYNQISISCASERLTDIEYFSFYAKFPVKRCILKMKLKIQGVVATVLRLRKKFINSCFSWFS